MAGPPDPSLIPAVPSQAAQDLAHTMVSVVIALNVIAFFVWVARLYTRFFPVFRFGSADYVISASYVLIIVDTIVLFLTMPYMFGLPASKFTLQNSINSQRYAVIAQPIWGWAMAGIKISILLMLLQLQVDTWWRRFCWTLMAFIMIVTIYNMCAQLTQCIPLRKTWDLLGVVPGKCWSSKSIRANLFAVAVFNFTTDFIVAMLPITFLRKMQRPLKDRLIIGVLMALGVFTGVASILKMVFAARFGETGDLNLDGVHVGMWSLLEMLIGFIAACLPYLRSPFQRLLDFLGLIPEHITTWRRGPYQMYPEDVPVKASRSAPSGASSDIRMKSLRNQTTQSEESILQNTVVDPQDGKIWQTTEVHIEHEPRGSARVGLSTV